MIEIINYAGQYEYEIHSLAKAFFPEEEIKVAAGRGEEADKSSLVFCFPDGTRKQLQVSLKDRDDLKRSLYLELSAFSGKKLPWGSLTGIRPVRLAMRRLDKGMSREDTIAAMKRDYLVSDEKAVLATDIAVREKKILSGLDRKGFSLYVNIPFCPTTCLYCSFTSNRVGKDRERVRTYLEALYREIKAVGELFSGRIPETVYIGGGTPTTLEASELEELINRLGESFDLCKLKEFTVEAGRPDTITPDKLRVLKKNGVSRISINPQTMNEKTLQVIGRRHTTEDVVRAFHEAREEGFDNINMDLILGLPGESSDDVGYTLSGVLKLDPDNLTVHSLAVKRASAMRELIEERGFFLTGDTARMMDLAIEKTAGAGLFPYYLYRQKNMSGNLENTGFAKEGKQGIYNILINEEVSDIAALGAGAISKTVDGDGTCRRSANYKMLDQYIANADEMGLRKEKLFAGKWLT
ncbi:MAG: coproporphyrinogen dehydrogenase HemZ [Lachnospiraceae bacterium]|nr:coproporphyrinogen dehydrogenase HemZ [Lachnospiraceae bacterium]